MLKGNILWQFKHFQIYEGLYGSDWVARVGFPIQIFLIFRGRYDLYSWDIRLKIYRLPNCNMLFQFLLTKCFKSELFSCLQKVWSTNSTLLIREGCRVDDKDCSGATPLHIAALYGLADTVNVLLNMNATVEMKDKNGKTPLEVGLGKCISRIRTKAAS